MGTQGIGDVVSRMMWAVDSVDDLLAQARSPRPDVRADAGLELAAHVGDERADAALILLIQDPEDTLPTLETATALLARGDDAGVRLLAVALADADEDSVTHSLDAMWGASATDAEFDALRARIERVMLDPQPAVQHGAAILLNWFTKSLPFALASLRLEAAS
jgi:hypothetical protein